MTAPKRYVILNKKNSEFPSCQIQDLSPIDWWLDTSSGRVDLHFQSIDGETWHSVYCKRSGQPRIASIDGVFYWLVDEKEKRNGK